MLLTSPSCAGRGEGVPRLLSPHLTLRLPPSPRLYIADHNAFPSPPPRPPCHCRAYTWARRQTQHGDYNCTASLGQRMCLHTRTRCFFLSFFISLSFSVLLLFSFLLFLLLFFSSLSLCFSLPFLLCLFVSLSFRTLFLF